MRLIIITIMLLLIMSGFSSGAGKKISEMGNKHNFSKANTDVNFRASANPPPGGYPAGYDYGSQICVFCHTPHRASGEGALWNRKAPATSFFKHYSSPTMAIDDILVRGASGYGQPNGSSRFCLSCHDGVTALGAVFTTPGVTTALNIPFTDVKGGQSGPNVALGYETYSTHHPVSFNYTPTVRQLLNDPPFNKNLIYSQPASSEVKLDKEGRMQCTTCHDPHQDKSATPSVLTPFWTTDTYDKACKTCHNIVPLPNPYPW